MKKLIFVFMLMAGFALNSKAQVLDYYLYNNSATEEWNFAMDDAGTSPALYELNIPPGDTRSGSLNGPLNPFTFPLDWKAQNTAGCYIYNTNVGPINTTVGTSCPGVDIDYKIVAVAPLVYVLKMQFN